ncbi:MAG TPA: sulfatase-like hydrolase/transferase [Terriglobales bacterium]|nr:sulfatase-like hydrolase/transferase [Terriglobales bacterium]
MLQAIGRVPEDDTSRKDILLVAAWFGLLTGIVEGLLFFHVRHLRILDLTWVPIPVDLILALIVALPLVALRNFLTGRPSLFLRAACLFAWLMFFDWLRVISPLVEPALPAPWPAAIAAHPLAETVIVMLLTLLLALGAALLLTRLRIRHAHRRSLPWVAAVAALLVIGLVTFQRLHERREISRLPAPPPGAHNVLVIVVDTLRADHLSTYGYARPTSPNLSRIADQGVLFENAMAPSSWTLPSHASMLTGLYPHQHGATYMGSSLVPHLPTLGEAFQHLGYRTAGFSASTYFFSRRTGLGRGFIHFEDDFESPDSAFAQTYYGERLEQLLYRLHIAKNRIGRRNARQISQHALRWIASDQRHPFFAFLNYYDVHDPYLPPEPYLHRFTKVAHPSVPLSNAWDWFASLTPEQRQSEMDAYDGAIQYMDTEMEEFLQQLHRRGLDKNTLVVITSDHGEEFNEHGFMDHLNALYRELIHVPLVFWEPGKVPAGVRISEPVSTVSLPSTLLSLANNGTSTLPGISLSTLWAHPGRKRQVMPVVSELIQAKLTPLFPNYYGPLTSITTPQWHYISGGKAGEELFVCCDEEPEQRNLAGTVVGRELAMRFEAELAPAAADELTVQRSNHPALGATYQMDFEPASLAFKDFDGNGDMDILVRGRNHHEFAVLLGNGKGAFQRTGGARPLEQLSTRKMGIQLRLASGKKTSNAQCCGTAAAGLNGAVASFSEVRLGDVNGDGLEDVLLEHGQGQISTWLRATAAGKFYMEKAASESVDPGKKRPITISHGDIDGNGLEDLAFVNEAHNEVVFLLATRPGVFIKATVSLGERADAIGLTDLNHDGRSDLVVISRANHSITVLLSL